MSRTDHLKTIEQRLLWLSHWMIHNANHRPKVRRDEGRRTPGLFGLDGLDHDRALFLGAEAEDRVAVKPHASPVFHAIQYLMGNQTLEKLKTSAALAARSPIPAGPRTSMMSTSPPARSALALRSPRLPPSCRTTSSAKDLGGDLPLGRMVALVGDAELDEGNIYECLQEGWKHDLRNTWWIIDYNRQSLDGIVHEGLFRRDREDLRGIRLGRGPGQVRRTCSAPRFREGRRKLKDWIDNCPNQLYAALTFMGGAVWRNT
jgi:pyruvate dehydrogenase E1 component